MNKKLILSIFLLIFFFIFFYFLNFNKRFDYTYSFTSIEDANIKKINQLSNDLSSFNYADLINNYNKYLNNFINSVLIFQKTIIENNYPTLQSLFNKYKDNLNKEDHAALLITVEEMKNVIKDSSLNSDIKISLYKQIRDFSVAYEDLIKAQNSINKNAVAVSELLFNKLQDFSKAKESNSVILELKNLEAIKLKYNIILILVLLFALLIIYFEYFNFKNKLKKEYKKILETCDAIKQSFNTEVLLKLKTSTFFNSLKNNLYETLKVFNNKIDFYKDYIYYHKIPIKYKDDYANEIKNKTYLELEKKALIADFFIYENKFFISYKDNNSEYYNYIDKNILISQIEKDFISDIEKGNLSNFSSETKLFLEKIKQDSQGKNRYLNKYLAANKRLKKIISSYRNLKFEFNKLELNIKKVNTESDIYFSKAINIKENILKIQSLIDNIKLKFNFNNDTFNNINDLKLYLKQNLNNINLLKLEFTSLLNKIDAHYKNLLFNNIDLDLDNLKDIKANFTRLIIDANNLKQILLNFDLSFKDLAIDDNLSFDELNLNLKDLNNDLDDLTKFTT